jgi:hypothetical protein
MKEQKDMKQDFDRWLFDQWKEETYVPSAQDRSIFSKKLRKRRAKKNWTIGLSLALLTLLILSVVMLRSPKPETKKSQQRIDVSIPKPIQAIPSTEIPAQQKRLLIPVNFLWNDQFLPSINDPFENLGSLEVPNHEPINIVQDLAPIQLKSTVNLDTIMNSLGVFYLQTSLYKDGEVFAGITSSHELVFARRMNGSYSLPTSPDTLSTEGGFRPMGMSGNQYVYYAFYDAKQLLFNEAVYRQVLAVNVLPRIAYYMRTAAPGWNSPLGVQMRQEVPQQISNATRNQDENMRRIARQAEPGNPYSPYKPGRPFYLRQPIRVNNMAKVGLLIGDNFLIKSQGEKVLVVSCDAERVSIVAQNGVIEASHSITIEYPRYFSQKAKYPFYDEESGRLYLIVETNFAYMWYEVDQYTGKTRYIFKTETIWNDPKWTINEGNLTYFFKGKTYRHSLD